MELTDDERDLILAGLIELTITFLENAERRERCKALARKLGGDPDRCSLGPSAASGNVFPRWWRDYEPAIGTLALFSATPRHSAGCCLPTADTGDLDEQHGPRRAMLAILTVLRGQQVDRLLARAAMLDHPATPRDPYPPQQ